MSNQIYDLMIKNCQIVDGTGKESFYGNIGIKGDKIIEIIKTIDSDSSAKKMIDAKGRYVVPGFVDAHTHIDFESFLPTKSILFDRYAENFVRQGITTTIGGQCGISGIDVGEYLYKINEGKIGPNAGFLIGHGSIRVKAMGGVENRKPTASEMEIMKSLLRKAMEDGSFGLSSGLGYTPGYYADEEEIAELCKVVKEYNGIYTSHIRNQDCDVRESWKEIISVGRKTGVHVHISHAQVIGTINWGASKELVEMFNDARKEGINITYDAIPYLSSGVSFIGALIPNWAEEGSTSTTGGKNEALNQRLVDPKILPRIKEEVSDLIKLRGNPDGILAVACISDPSRSQEITGKYISDFMKEWNLEAEEVVIKLILEYGDIAGACFQCCSEDRDTFYDNQYCAVISDANCELDQRLMGIECVLREYGSFPRFFYDYVKEKKKFTIEEGIRKMTSLPAQTIGIVDRGVIKEGMKADIVILDYDKIEDKSTLQNTHQYPAGIDVVIINGKVVILEGIHQQILSGEGLYRKNRD